MKQPVRITGVKAVAINQYSRFDPKNPEKTNFNEFALFTPDKDGNMSESWVKDGYIQVGTATVEIELMPAKEVTAGAVVALRKQKDSVLAKAQREATQIERQIQNLLAITNEA